MLLYRTKSELLHTLYVGFCIEEWWKENDGGLIQWHLDSIKHPRGHYSWNTNNWRCFVKSDDPYNSVIPGWNAHNSAKINYNALPQPHMPHQAHVTVVVVGIFWALAIFPWDFYMFPSIPSPVSASSCPMKFEKRLNEWLNMDRQQSYSQRKFVILSPAIVTLWSLSISKKNWTDIF